jgi:hypothetical protein
MKVEIPGLRAGWAGFFFVLAIGLFVGPVCAQDEQEMIRKDASTFGAFYGMKLDALKEALRAKDKVQVRALEERIVAEECRFLTRTIWNCRQQKVLAKRADELQAYLEGYRNMTPGNRLKARLAVAPGQPDVCRLVLGHLEGSIPTQAPVAVALAPRPESARPSKLRKREWELQPGEMDERSHPAPSGAGSDMQRLASVSRTPSPLPPSFSDGPSSLSDSGAKASGIRPRAGRR